MNYSVVGGGKKPMCEFYYYVGWRDGLFPGRVRQPHWAYGSEDIAQELWDVKFAVSVLYVL